MRSMLPKLLLILLTYSSAHAASPTTENCSFRVSTMDDHVRMATCLKEHLGMIEQIIGSTEFQASQFEVLLERGRQAEGEYKALKAKAQADRAFESRRDEQKAIAEKYSTAISNEINRIKLLAQTIRNRQIDREILNKKIEQLAEIRILIELESKK